VLAACEEIQQAEIPEQSALYQRMFERFNARYFAGRLPDYKIRVVYDVWYWETERLGYPKEHPAFYDVIGSIDFPSRQILIRFLGQHAIGCTMTECLLHEMGHAATDGGHGDNWLAEMKRLKGLGAPVSESDLSPYSEDLQDGPTDRRTENP
jgi:hypothetical protein